MGWEDALAVILGGVEGGAGKLSERGDLAYKAKLEREGRNKGFQDQLLKGLALELVKRRAKEGSVDFGDMMVDPNDPDAEFNLDPMQIILGLGKKATSPAVRPTARPRIFNQPSLVPTSRVPRYNPITKKFE